MTAVRPLELCLTVTILKTWEAEAQDQDLNPKLTHVGISEMFLESGNNYLSLATDPCSSLAV